MSAAERTKRTPTEAALPTPSINRGRHLEPFLSEPEPRLLIDRIDCLDCLLSAFLGLLAKPGCIIIGHGNRIMHRSEIRTLALTN